MKKTVISLLITCFTITLFSYSMNAPTELFDEKKVTPIPRATYFKIHYSSLCQVYKINHATIHRHNNHDECPDHDYLEQLMMAPESPFSRIVTYHDGSWGIIHVINASKTDIWGDDFVEHCRRRLDPQSKPKAYQANIFYCHKTGLPLITFFDAEGEAIFGDHYKGKACINKIAKMYNNYLDFSDFEIISNSIENNTTNSSACIIF